jgi:putative nucleotidyltransferase with HDIG domain
MAISLNRTTYGDLVDPFDGIRHLNEHLLKTPLPAAETFDDDPLRIMRMCRFASQLGFIPAQDVLYSAAALVDRLEIVSQARITTEFIKIMESSDPVRGLKILMAIGAFGVFLPELVALEGQEQRNDCHHKDVWLHTLEVVEKVTKMTGNVWVRVGALFHDIGKPQTKGFIDDIGWTFHGHEEAGAKMIKPLFEKLKLPFEQIPLVETIVGMHGRFRGIEHSGKVTKAAVRRLIVAAEPYLEELLIVYKCDFSSKNPLWVAKMESINKRALDRIEEVLKSDANIIKFKLALGGKKIMEILNLKEGKDVGIVKGVLECALIEGFVANTEEDLAIYLKDIKDTIISFALANNLLFKRDLPNAEEIAGKLFDLAIEKE